MTDITFASTNAYPRNLFDQFVKCNFAKNDLTSNALLVFREVFPNNSLAFLQAFDGKQWMNLKEVNSLISGTKEENQAPIMYVNFIHSSQYAQYGIEVDQPKANLVRKEEDQNFYTINLPKENSSDDFKSKILKVSLFEKLLFALHMLPRTRTSQVEALIERRQAALKGKTSLDTWEEDSITPLYHPVEEAEETFNNCVKYWNFDESHKKIFKALHLPFGEFYFNLIESGSFLSVQNAWFDNFRTSYCERHPNDDYSCNLQQLKSETESDEKLKSRRIAWIKKHLAEETIYSRKFAAELMDFFREEQQYGMNRTHEIFPESFGYSTVAQR